MARRIYSFIRLASLDILAGAAALYMFVSHILEINISWYVLLILLLSIWIIYTLDHILDADNLQDIMIKNRYIWHQKNRKILIKMVFFFILAVIVLLFMDFSFSLLVFGMIIGLIVFIYFSIHQGFKKPCRRYFFKEFWIGIIYTSGICGIPVISTWNEISHVQWMLILNIYFLVQVNILLYSWYEYPTDKEESLNTLSTRYSPTFCLRLISAYLIFSIGISVSALLLAFGSRGLWQEVWLLIIMCIILSGISFYPAYFIQKERYGIVADLVFILPAGILFF